MADGMVISLVEDFPHPCENGAIAAEAISSRLRVPQQDDAGVVVILKTGVKERHRKATGGGIARRIRRRTSDRCGANRED